MLVANGTLIVTFVCVDSAGAPTAPTGTPTGVLFKNGSSTAVTVTVTMSTAAGVASATIPSNAVQGDVFHITITGTVSGTEYKVSSDPETVFASAVPANVTQFGGAGGTFSGGRPEIIVQDGGITAAKLGADAITAAKVASDVSAEFATAMLTDLLSSSNFNTVGSFGKLVKDYLDAAVSSRSTYAGGDTAGTTTLLSRITATRAGYLDNLSGGTIATQADINAINQSASRRIILTMVGQWERPESGSIEYTIEARTYDGDGAAVNADSTPTLTVTGSTSGSLAANLANATNPATGVYRWQYTVSSSATLEQVRVDISAVISSATFTLSAYSQTTDLVSTTWTSADRTKLTAVYDKLPVRSYLTGTDVNSGAISSSDQAAIADVVWEDTLAEHPTAGTFGGFIQSLATAASLTTAAGNISTILGKLTGITYLKNWLAVIMGKTADSTTLAEVDDTTAGASYDNTTDSLQALRDQGDSGAWGGSGGSGLTGANLVTLTVTDGTDPVPGARVRVKAGAQTEVKATNASGVVTFSLDNNAWSVRITSPGLTFEATTLSVTGDVTQTYTMTEAATDGDYYATGDDLVDYFDAKTIGMMLLDNGTSVAASSVATHPSIDRFLRLASGSVNSALMASKRYSADDLTGLTGESEELLKQITCDIAMYHIARRRMDIQPERTESLRKIAEGHLERLRKGELILEVDAVKEAGIIDHAVLTQAEMQQGVQLVRHRVGYYPVQQTSRTQ